MEAENSSMRIQALLNSTIDDHNGVDVVGRHEINVKVSSNYESSAEMDMSLQMEAKKANNNDTFIDSNMLLRGNRERASLFKNQSNQPNVLLPPYAYPTTKLKTSNSNSSFSR